MACDCERKYTAPSTCGGTSHLYLSKYTVIDAHAYSAFYSARNLFRNETQNINTWAVNWWRWQWCVWCINSPKKGRRHAHTHTSTHICICYTLFRGIQWKPHTIWLSLPSQSFRNIHTTCIGGTGARSYTHRTHSFRCSMLEVRTWTRLPHISNEKLDSINKRHEKSPPFISCKAK